MEGKPVQLSYHLPLILIFTVYISVSAAEQTVVPSIKTDAVALLGFKKMIDNDPTGVLSGWKLETSPCLWYGVKCSSGRVVQLDLNQCSLYGTIFFNPLASLDMLSSLDLSGNMFTVNSTTLLLLPYGLKRLQLSDTGLFGLFPDTIFSKLPNLEYVNLSHNNLTGTLPDNLFSSNPDKLQVLDLSANNITGSISGLKLENSCNSLLVLDLSSNRFVDSIPVYLSNCTKLTALNLSLNSLTGEIPSSLGELKTLQSFCLSFTSPGFMILPSWEKHVDYFWHQAFLSTLFGQFDFSLNYLNGSIPTELGALANLEQLIAWFNDLEGQIPKELGKCSKLKDLILNNNRLSGEIPVELFNCSNLEWISLTSNELTGSIPREFGLLSRLAVLQLANNSLSGEIPGELGNCTSLVWLDLNSNKLTGEIPPRLGRQLGAKSLSGILSGNTLVFVRNVGNSCKGVGGLLEFAGIRPERLLQISNLKSCDFTRMYSGAVLSLFTQYQTLEYLDLSYNQLRGKIPDEIGEMVALQVLELAHNQLSGEIPSSLGQLRNLGVFDASHNRLQGQIPESFSNLSFLVQIDLSYNELTGPIPQRGQLSTLPATQYANNPGLCGVPLPECRNGNNQAATSSDLDGGKRRRKPAAVSWANSIVLGILISIASICILIVWAIAMRARRREAEEVKMLNRLQAVHAATTWKIEKEKEPLSINVATFQRQLRKLKFSTLIEATNGFSAASLIGCGGFGEVFKATLKDGSSVAIKKLIRLSCQGDREFMAEMETLGKIKHRNLVPLLGYCMIGEERLLVYEFMEYGSLEEMLHGRTKARDRRILTWEERKKIARGAAKGLCFLHHNCIPHIIHRDMKSSNVLLDHEMEARVSDFGMARLISALDTHLSVSTLAGTPGYVPPEYYQSFRCTVRGDVYSFGVVLLELLTGKRPTDKEDFGDTNLVGWVKMKVREQKHMEVIDPEILLVTKGTDEAEAKEVKEMMRYLEITLQCVDDFPSKRPSMLQVVAMLRELMPGSANGSSNSA
ncbi:hypothetical protein GOBAR_DD32113 [Gossypium barbadense]|nr:hypothetical protein GOBAR_DD32113 [Gossypium barbadense]